MSQVPNPNVDPSVDFGLIRSRLTRAVARLCPWWLANERDDLVQAACMRLMDRLAQREENTPLSSSYIWKVAFSVTVDEIRRVRRRPEVPLVDDVVQRAAGLVNPEQSAEWREAGQAIVKCLGGLSLERRLAVTAYLQGHSIKESARLLGWTGKKYENLMYRGLDDLRRCLRAKGIEL
jgi:RNA polymerase sigma-70 factor (ECF subfamily)